MGANTRAIQRRVKTAKAQLSQQGSLCLKPQTALPLAHQVFERVLRVLGRKTCLGSYLFLKLR
jgi:hypothetical protein